MEEKLEEIFDVLRKDKNVEEVSISKDGFRVSAYLNFTTPPKEEVLEEVGETIDKKVGDTWETNGVQHSESEGYVIHFRR